LCRPEKKNKKGARATLCAQAHYYWAAGKRKADAFSIGFSPPKYMVEVKGA